MSRQSRRSRNTLLWALGVFALTQGLLVVAMFKWPVWRDPEPGVKRRVLAERQSEKAQTSPLVLALGSSRMAMDFRPEMVSVSRRKSKKLPLVFNFGLTQTITVRQLMVLQSLLAEGVRPSEVLLEYYPEFLTHPMHHLYWVYDIQRASPADMRILQKMDPVPFKTTVAWWRGQFLPAYYHRRLYLNYAMPDWVEPDLQNFSSWTGITDHGWLKYPRSATAVQRNVVLDELLQSEQRRGSTEWNVNPVAEKAFWQTLDLCREHHLKVTLIMLPEYGPHWGQYSAEATRLQEAFLDRILREYSCPVVDARDWLDEGWMSDPAHATHEGASVFTERLCREYLEAALDATYISGNQEFRKKPAEPGRVIGGAPSVSWGGGFFEWEGTGKLVWRWAKAEARIHLRARKTRRVEMRFSVNTGHTETARLEVLSDLFPPSHTQASAVPVEWVKSFEVPAGEHILTLRCDARPIDAPEDSRTMIFRITNPEIKYVE